MDLIFKYIRTMANTSHYAWGTMATLFRSVIIA